MKTDLRRWLAFGTGVGIEIRADVLRVAAVRVRPSEVGVLGAATVTEYKTRPAAEWGTELAQFLRKLGSGHMAATALLPRHDVIVRQIVLPGVSDSDMDGAIELQIDSLHPFNDEEIYYSWARLGKTANILIGISRREVIDRYSAMFAEAGIKIAAFTFSAAVLYSASRLITTSPPGGFLALREDGEDLEIYGESESRPIFSASVPGDPNQAAAFAAAELRLSPEVEPRRVYELLPKPSVFPESYDPAQPEYEANALTYATALAGACPWMALEANLLPAEKRKGSSRVRLIPTFALGTVLALLVGALAAQSKWEDSRYLGLLQHEIRRLEPLARRGDAISKQFAATRARTQALDDFRRRTKLDIDAIGEVTRIIAPPGWVNSLDLDRAGIQIGGEMEQAATLLKLLDNSPYFTRSEFTMPISKQGVGEAFRVKAVRRAPSGPAPVPTAVQEGGPPPVSMEGRPQGPPNPFSGAGR